jgi:hypothetical protein
VPSTFKPVESEYVFFVYTSDADARLVWYCYQKIKVHLPAWYFRRNLLLSYMKENEKTC